MHGCTQTLPFAALAHAQACDGALDTMVQRGKIQEASKYDEHKKHDGALPLAGVNMFLPKEHAGEIATGIELIRSTEEKKGQQIENVRNWQEGRNALAPKGETSHAHPPDADEQAPMVHDGVVWRIFRTLRANGAMCSKR